jgi:hypothetical protein
MDEGCFVVLIIIIVIVGAVGLVTKGCDGNKGAPAKVAVVEQPPAPEPAPAPVPPKAANWDLEFPYFDVGSIPFWILTVALVLLLTVCMEYEQGFIATLLTLLYAATLQWRGHLDILGYIDKNRIETIYIVFGLFAAGCVVAFGKWYLFLQQLRTAYDERKAAWLERNGIHGTLTIPDSYKKRWADYVSTTGIQINTKARDHKGRIIRWICFWPVVLIWSIVDDMVKEFGRFVYRRLANVFQRMSNHVWRNVDEDFTIAEPPPKPQFPEL